LSRDKNLAKKKIRVLPQKKIIQEKIIVLQKKDKSFAKK